MASHIKPTVFAKGVRVSKRSLQTASGDHKGNNARPGSCSIGPHSIDAFLIAVAAAYALTESPIFIK